MSHGFVGQLRIYQRISVFDGRQAGDCDQRAHWEAGSLFRGEGPLRIGALTNLYLEQMNLFLKSYRKLKKYPGAADEVEASAEVQEEQTEYCPVCGTMYPDPKRKICPKCMNKRSIFTRTMGYFFRYKWKFITLFFCYFAAAGLNLVWPYLNGTILYDKVLKMDNGF